MGPVAQASLAAWRKTTARLPDLAALHVWLHHEHACYSVARQVPPLFLVPFLLLPFLRLPFFLLPFTCPPSSWHCDTAAAWSISSVVTKGKGSGGTHDVAAARVAHNCGRALCLAAGG